MTDPLARHPARVPGALSASATLKAILIGGAIIAVLDGLNATAFWH